jgi:cyclophilin family peptidyl-prolyl cis-trans isomerase
MTLLPIHPARRLAVLAATVAIAAAACSSAASSPIPTVGPITPAPSVAPPTAPPAHTSGCPTSAPAPMKAGETATVTVETSKGTIVMKIEGDLGPNAAGNFVALAECGFYDGVVFHRLVPGFVIQGGDPTGTGGGGPGYTIKDEPVKGEYKRGTLAMARTQGSQFFIVLDDQAKAALDSARTYAIFGEVVSGMDVVDAIAAMPNSGEPNNTALDPVSMDKVTVTRP